MFFSSGYPQRLHRCPPETKTFLDYFFIINTTFCGVNLYYYQYIVYKISNNYKKNDRKTPGRAFLLTPYRAIICYSYIYILCVICIRKKKMSDREKCMQQNLSKNDTGDDFTSTNSQRKIGKNITNTVGVFQNKGYNHSI